ncbi:MAG: hypothetical protein RLZ98_3 [Pseudomonadota bacterium]|jgi:hypothetical protein
MLKIEPVTLAGNCVALVPLAPSHSCDLAEAAADGDLHKLWYTWVPAPDDVAVEIDGVLRSHRIMANGTIRDTCVYSIIAAEWPTVKAHLVWQIERHGGSRA